MKASRIAEEAKHARELVEGLGDEVELRLNPLAVKIGDAFGNAFEKLILGTEKARDAFRQLGRDIMMTFLRQGIKELIINPISRIGAVEVQALGNVFDRGRVLAFAGGGIVRSPTAFPMPDSRVGLMGENGPEAIMPVKRGASGRPGFRRRSPASRGFCG